MKIKKGKGYVNVTCTTRSISVCSTTDSYL